MSECQHQHRPGHPCVHPLRKVRKRGAGAWSRPLVVCCEAVRELQKDGYDVRPALGSAWYDAEQWSK